MRADPPSPVRWKEKDSLGEFLPPLYPELNGGALLVRRFAERILAGTFSLPAPIYYFLRADGQVVVTNDLSTVDASRGRVISVEEAGCLLRGKASPCDNAARW